MEATFLKRAFGIGEGWAYRSTKYFGRAVEVHIKAKREEIQCPKCQADHIALRGTRERRIRSVPIGMKPVIIVAHVPRCQCRKCGEFFDSSPLLPPRGRSYTHGLERFVAGLCRMMSLKDTPK